MLSGSSCHLTKHHAALYIYFSPLTRKVAGLQLHLLAKEITSTIRLITQSENLLNLNLTYNKNKDFINVSFLQSSNQDLHA